MRGCRGIICMTKHGADFAGAMESCPDIYKVSEQTVFCSGNFLFNLLIIIITIHNTTHHWK